jgi:hypothetical protein
MAVTLGAVYTDTRTKKRGGAIGRC